jgi:hypothetical protein
LDAIVHVGGETIYNSTAYLVEASYSPQVNEIQILTEKVKKFKKLLPRDKHFKTITNVVPVLAGRHWGGPSVKAAEAAKLWRVAPSAKGYEVIRSFHSLVIKILK